MIIVRARKGESVDSILRRFQKKVLLEGTREELKNRRFYKKPSQVRKEQIKEKKRKIKKYQREL